MWKCHLPCILHDCLSCPHFFKYFSSVQINHVVYRKGINLIIFIGLGPIHPKDIQQDGGMTLHAPWCSGGGSGCCICSGDDCFPCFYVKSLPKPSDGKLLGFKKQCSTCSAWQRVYYPLELMYQLNGCRRLTLTFMSI